MARFFTHLLKNLGLFFLAAIPFVIIAGALAPLPVFLLFAVFLLSLVGWASVSIARDNAKEMNNMPAVSVPPVAPLDPMSEIEFYNEPSAFEDEDDESFVLAWRYGVLVNTLTGEVLSFPANENQPPPCHDEPFVVHTKAGEIIEWVKDEEPVQQELDIPDPRPIAVVYIP